VSVGPAELAGAEEDEAAVTADEESGATPDVAADEGGRVEEASPPWDAEDVVPRDVVLEAAGTALEDTLGRDVAEELLPPPEDVVLPAPPSAHAAIIRPARPNPNTTRCMTDTSQAVAQHGILRRATQLPAFYN